MTQRQEWAKTHPWLSGLYGGILASCVAFVIGIAKSRFLAVVLVALVWALAVPIVIISVKRRWFLGDEDDERPRPTLRRPFTRNSDKSLTRLFWFYAGVGAISAFVVLDPEQRTSALFMVAFSAAILISVSAERRHRH